MVILLFVGYLIFDNFQNKVKNSGEKENGENISNEVSKELEIIDDKNNILEEKEKVIEESANAGVKEIEIIAKQWEFQPAVIELKKGDKVKLKIRSVDVAHGFAIPVGYKMDKRLNPGEIIEVEFVADKTGEFPYFCSIGCGRGHFDMKGKIIVSE